MENYEKLKKLRITNEYISFLKKEKDDRSESIKSFLIEDYELILDLFSHSILIKKIGIKDLLKLSNRIFIFKSNLLITTCYCCFNDIYHYFTENSIFNCKFEKVDDLFLKHYHYVCEFCQKAVEDSKNAQIELNEKNKQ